MSSTKGPIIWGDMDQRALDDAYDQSVWAPNQKIVQQRRTVSSERARAALGAPLRFQYGAREIEGLDVFRTEAANAPVQIFIHGGAWKNGRSCDFAAPAEMFVAAGAHYVALDFDAVTDVGGDLDVMADQVRRGVAWVARNADRFGGDPSRIFVSGHSSGGHLTSCVLVTDWSVYGLSASPLSGALCCSGMYELEPVRLSKRSQYVAFTDACVADLSAMRHLDRISCPVLVGFGTEESPEFMRQGRAFADALSSSGRSVRVLIGEGYNHFEMLETYYNPYGLLGRAVLQQMGLGSG